MSTMSAAMDIDERIGRRASRDNVLYLFKNCNLPVPDQLVVITKSQPLPRPDTAWGPKIVTIYGHGKRGQARQKGRERIQYVKMRPGQPGTRTAILALCLSRLRLWICINIYT